jgi:hypothetical protein
VFFDQTLFFIIELAAYPPHALVGLEAHSLVIPDLAPVQIQVLTQAEMA